MITSSGFVHPNLYGDLGKILTSHIPIAGRFALLNIIFEAKKRYKTIYITIDSSAINLIGYLEKTQNIKVIYSNSANNLDANFKLILKELTKKVKQLDILFGDSLTSDLIKKEFEFGDCIFVSNTQESNLFTSIKRDEMTNLLSFDDRTDFTKEAKVTGSFKISDLDQFSEIFNRINADSNLNIFWNTWVEYDSNNNYFVKLTEDRSWSDIGHMDNYFAARRDSMPGTSRHFNSVAINIDSQCVVKSGPTQKIELEKKWYKQIPKNLKKFTPLVLVDDNHGEYEMEYVSSVPLNEMWISENNDASYWLGFRNQMETMLQELHSSVQEERNELSTRISKHSMYFEKFEKRTEQFIKNHKYLLRRDLKINSLTLPSFEQVLTAMAEVSNKLASLSSWSVIHGDLCFSNIIFDRRKNILVLIDPRGSFGQDGIYGDPIYDLAKLSHSINGNYDYFACDLYALSRFENNFEITTAVPEKPLISRTLSRELIQNEIKKYPIDFNDLRTIEAGLFMSASILHTESDRGLALYLNGMHIMRDIFA